MGSLACFVCCKLEVSLKTFCTMTTSKENKKITGVYGTVGGALTGSLEICVTYPIKYVKTQLQLEQKFGAARQYNGMIDCTKQTIQKHGVAGLYRGLNIFMYAPKSGIRFGGFETFKSWLVDENGNLSARNKFLCGVMAGTIEATIVNTPLETIEVKLINDQRAEKQRFRGFVHGARTIIREEGFRGIYQGLFPSIIKQASNQGIRFFVVESLRSWYQGGDSSVSVPKMAVTMFGAVAGFCSVMGNNPIDVVKTRMQGLDASRYNNFLNCFVKIWKQEGPYSFYRGVTPRLSRVCLEVALTFLIYELIQDGFKALNQSKSR